MYILLVGSDRDRMGWVGIHNDGICGAGGDMIPMRKRSR
jgi:hypothetical protein